MKKNSYSIGIIYAHRPPHPQTRLVRCAAVRMSKNYLCRPLYYASWAYFEKYDRLPCLIPYCVTYLLVKK